MVIFNLEEVTHVKYIPFSIQEDNICGVLQISTDEYGEEYFVEFDQDLEPTKQTKYYRQIIEEYKSKVM